MTEMFILIPYFLISFTADNVNRRAGEIKGFSQLIFYIPSVAEMHQLHVVHEQDEGRRADAHLRTVIDA